MLANHILNKPDEMYSARVWHATWKGQFACDNPLNKGDKDIPSIVTARALMEAICWCFMFYAALCYC